MLEIPSRINHWAARGFFLAALCLFSFVAVYNLTDCFPCETIDEYCKFHVARKFIRIFSGTDEWSDLFRWPVATDFRVPFLMHNNYVGWPALYLAVGMMSVFGKALGYFFVFRLTSVLYGVLTLCSMRYVLKRWFGEWAAGLTVFFVACNYSYIQAVRHGFYREEIFQLCGLWCGLALCHMAHKRKLWLYLGFFVFGITFWAKIMFVAYVIGASAAFLVLGSKRRKFIRVGFPSSRSALISCLFFLSGAAPFIWFNLRYGFPTVRLINSRLLRFSEVLETDNWNNGDVFGNFLQRCYDFYLYLSQEIVFGVCDNLFKIIYVVLFVCAFFWGCSVLSGRWGRRELTLSLRALFVFYAVVLCLSCFVPTEHQSGHILVLVPFAEILCALFVVNIGRIKNIVFLAVLICGLWFGEQLNHMYMFWRDYPYDGQVYGLNKGDYDVMLSWLRSKKIKRILCPAPMGSLLYIIGDGRDIEIYDLVSGREHSANLIAEEISLQVSHAPAYCLLRCDNYIRHSRIKDFAARHGIKIQIVDIKTFKRDSVHTFMLCLASRTNNSGRNKPVFSGV